MTARYRLMTSMFIEPELFKEGTILDYEGEPHSGMEPLNQEAEDALKAYYAKKPEASLHPEQALPKTVAAPVVVPPSAPAVPTASAKKGS